MAIVPEEFQERLDNFLQETMTYTPLSVIYKGTVKKKRIEVLQDLSKPSSFDNYIDVMQQYIDLAHKILSDGFDKPIPKFSGQDGWDKDISRLQRHFKAFTDNIIKLTDKWMGVDYKTKYDVDFLEPLKLLTTDASIVYWTRGYDTPEWLFPLFEDLKKRLISMTEKDTMSTEAEKAINVWKVCKTLQDRAMFIADDLISMMVKIRTMHKTVVSINLKEITARASPSTTSGGRRTRHKRSGKRSGNKRSGKRSGKKRSGKRSGKRSVHKSRRR